MSALTTSVRANDPSACEIPRRRNEREGNPKPLRGDSAPSKPAWVRDLRDQCVDAGVPFFFKQWGDHAPDSAGKNVGKI